METFCEAGVGIVAETPAKQRNVQLEQNSMEQQYMYDIQHARD